MTARGRPVSVHELETAARMARLPVARARRYLRIGLIDPSRVEGDRALFDDIQIARLRRIRRLGDDLGLDTAAIGIVLRLLDRIEALQRELDARRTTSQEVPR
jgi:MerR family transcriptional regulator/heat shock protein HspR